MPLTKKTPVAKRPVTRRRLVPVAETRDLTAGQRHVLDATLAKMAELRNDRDNIDAEYVVLEAKALELLDLLDMKKSSTTLSDGSSVSATRIQAERAVIDEARLKKRLGAFLWGKVTTQALDRKKLEQAVASGEVKAAAVADCTDLFPNKPFVKITRR